MSLRVVQTPESLADFCQSLTGIHPVHAPGIAVLGRNQLQCGHDLVAAAFGHVHREILRAQTKELPVGPSQHFPVIHFLQLPPFHSKEIVLPVLSSLTALNVPSWL